jgi:hypothetical protein
MYTNYRKCVQILKDLLDSTERAQTSLSQILVVAGGLSWNVLSAPLFTETPFRDSPTAPSWSEVREPQFEVLEELLVDLKTCVEELTSSVESLKSELASN